MFFPGAPPCLFYSTSLPRVFPLPMKTDCDWQYSFCRFKTPALRDRPTPVKEGAFSLSHTIHAMFSRILAFSLESWPFPFSSVLFSTQPLLSLLPHSPSPCVITDTDHWFFFFDVSPRFAVDSRLNSSFHVNPVTTLFNGPYHPPTKKSRPSFSSSGPPSLVISPLAIPTHVHRQPLLRTTHRHNISAAGPSHCAGPLLKSRTPIPPFSMDDVTPPPFLK